MKWISVKERLPEMALPYASAPYKASERVLIFNGYYAQVGKYSETYTGRKARWESDGGRVADVTHWMPLPEPPAQQSKGEQV